MKKLINKSFHQKEEGFTLIELLIVIVIIGILAGILLTVLNPIRQQNRSRNATIRASVLKVAFAINAVRAGIGSLPSNSQLQDELENISPNGTGCDTASETTLDCLFTLAGTNLPQYCQANSERPGATGTGNRCLFRVVSGGDNAHGNLGAGPFRVGAAAFDLDTRNPDRYSIVFDSSQGLLMCGNGVPWAAVGSDGFDRLETVDTPNPGSGNCVILSE